MEVIHKIGRRKKNQLQEYIFLKVKEHILLTENLYKEYFPTDILQIQGKSTICNNRNKFLLMMLK